MGYLVTHQDDMKILLYFLLLISTIVHSQESNEISASEIISTQVNRYNLINECIDKYVEKKAKTSAKVKINLYDLIYNFDKIDSRLRGKKQTSDSVSFDDKVGTLAKIQCEAYYNIGVLD